MVKKTPAQSTPQPLAVKIPACFWMEANNLGKVQLVCAARSLRTLVTVATSSIPKVGTNINKNRAVKMPAVEANCASEKISIPQKKTKKGAKNSPQLLSPQPRKERSGGGPSLTTVQQPAEAFALHSHDQTGFRTARCDAPAHPVLSVECLADSQNLCLESWHEPEPLEPA